MQNFEFTVKDPVGIHARPAGVLVKKAQSLSSDIAVKCRGKSADLKKLLAVMSLGAKCGDVVSVTVSGENELSDTEALKEAVKNM